MFLDFAKIILVQHIPFFDYTLTRPDLLSRTHVLKRGLKSTPNLK